MRRRTDVYIGVMRDGSAIVGATNAAATASHDGDVAAARAMLHGVPGDAPPVPATAGECLTGRQILHRTGETVRDTYGPGDPLGVRMRDRLADLTRQCRATGVDAAEPADAVADHICGRPAATASISTTTCSATCSPWTS